KRLHQNPPGVPEDFRRKPPLSAASERRARRRFDLSFPIQVRLRTDASGEVATSTRDISSNGLYFTMSETAELGSELECVLTLPNQSGQLIGVKVYCRGRIVRVERPDVENRIGVAATIEEYEFIKPATPELS